MKRVYLAGPPFAEEYRRRAEELLRKAGLEPVNPMRREGSRPLAAARAAAALGALTVLYAS